MSDDDRHDDDRALDRLLARAKWEEPTAADEYRLREDWMHLRRRRRIMPMVYLAVAASIAVIAGTIVMLRPVTQPIARDPAPQAPMLLVTHGDNSPRVESRPANAFEQLLVMQTMPRPRPAAPFVAVLDPATQQLLHQLDDPLMNKRFAAARALADVEQPQVIPILVELVDRKDNRAALAALMLSKTPAAVDALAMVRNSPTVDAQFMALRNELR